MPDPSLPPDLATDIKSTAPVVDEYDILPEAVVRDLRRFFMGDPTPDAINETLARLEVLKSTSRATANDWLAVVDPEVVLDVTLLLSVLAQTMAGKYLCDKAGFNRFAWMIAVAGGGTDRSAESLSAFVRAAAQWVAADIVSNQVSQKEYVVSRGVDTNPWFESARRYMPVPVHMRWASELICTSIAEAVQSDQAKYPELEIMQTGAITEVFGWVDEKSRNRDRVAAGLQQSPITSLSAQALQLLDALAIDASELRGKSFDALIDDLDNEAYPFVAFAGGIEPVSEREATYRLELALFNLARRLLTDDKDRSDLFESVVKRVLGSVAPSDMAIAAGEANCPIPNSDNPGETDFVARDECSTFIGECKSMVAAPRPRSVINSFQDDVGKATRQLEKRMKALQVGGIMLVGGKPWETPSASIFGLAVTFHDYGGAVWHHECLPLINGTTPEMAVIPLHQLVMAVRAMTNGAHLAEYIGFRSAIFRRGYEVFDELDLLVPFLFEEHREALDLQADASRQGHQRLPTYGVDHEARLCDTMPTGSDAWRLRLKSILK